MKGVPGKLFDEVLSMMLENNISNNNSNTVDEHEVPIRHFGIILSIAQWNNLANNLNKNKIKFIIKPYTRFKGEIGEQSTMFIKDPSGNALEFKAFKNDKMIFEN